MKNRIHCRNKSGLRTWYPHTDLTNGPIQVSGVDVEVVWNESFTNQEIFELQVDTRGNISEFA